MLRRTAPAKINLGLHVLRKRADGYHDLETVFIRIPWADEITVTPADSLTLSCSDPALPTGETNLCIRAAQRLQAAIGERRGAALHLDKHVPYGAGLGGGSSDAAATLRLLCDHWESTISNAALHEMAAGIGSDVPFFLGPPAAFGSGRGEILEPLMDALGGLYELPFALTVVVPSVAVSTAEAYRLVTPSAHSRPDLRAAVRSNDLARWRAEIRNDFEEPILQAYPVIRAAKDLLLDAGAGYAALSGSGSAVFGIFEDHAPASAAAEAARQTGHRAWNGFVIP